MKIIECVPNFSEGRDPEKSPKSPKFSNHFPTCGWPISAAMLITIGAFYFSRKAR